MCPRPLIEMLKDDLAALLALLPAILDHDDPALLDGEARVLGDELAGLVNRKKSLHLYDTRGKELSYDKKAVNKRACGDKRKRKDISQRKRVPKQVRL